MRLALVPMSSQLVRAVLQKKEWTVARHLLGTPFPLEWRDDGWQWLEWQATRGGWVEIGYRVVADYAGEGWPRRRLQRCWRGLSRTA